MSSDEKLSMGSLFQNKVIRTILLSVFFLQIGIWVRNYSILLYVIEKTDGNPIAVSMISVAEYAPIFLFSFIGGTFADRWRPKKTMIWCDLLSALSVFIVLLTLFFGSWKVIFFATLFSSILSQFSQPSGMKLFKLHVPERLVQMGMSVYQTVFALFMILGPVIGTFVYQEFGILAAIAIMGVAFLLSAAALLLLPADQVSSESRPATTLVQEMKAGFRYVWSSKPLTLLGACFAAAGLGVGLTQPLGVFIITERLGLPKENLQWLMAAFGIGMVLGGGVALALSRKATPQILLSIGMAASAIGFVGIGWSTVFGVTLAFEFFAGLLMPCIHIGINTMILQNTEESFIGRVNGIMNPLFIGTTVISMSLSGWLKSNISITLIFEAAAILMIIGILTMVPLFKKGAVPQEVQKES
ncbi:MFS transporter [Bacillus massilinigeriensis]|uniref:MFS transporter n=1 Tax=Bacillus mediterraneensis TaxID=1805474 RepID=UPI0008F96C19|nr:MFS transporter [Bacillus mediterraneensis]